MNDGASGGRSKPIKNYEKIRNNLDYRVGVDRKFWCKNIFATSKFMVALIVVDTPFIRPDQSPLLQ